MAAVSVSMFASPRSRGLMRAWQGTAAVGLALLVVYELFGGSLGGLDDFFNRYWYNALILLALTAAVVRAVTARSERAPGSPSRSASARGRSPSSCSTSATAPVRRIRRLPTGSTSLFYPACYIGLLLLVKSRLSEFSRALWLDGAMAAIAAAALGAAVLFEVVLRNTDGSTGGDRHEPGLPARRHPAALRRDRRVLADRLEARPDMVPDRRVALDRPPSRTGSSSFRPPPTRTARARCSTRCGPRRCSCSRRLSGSRRITPVSRSTDARSSRRRWPAARSGC